MKRKNIDKSGDDKYGHWWTEINGNESYGWWPKYPVGAGFGGACNTLGGVEGELNGQTSFGGTPTRDPHHGTAADEQFNPKTDSDCDCDAPCKEAADCFRKFAQSYSGEWRWTLGWGQNCRTFQEDGMSQCHLRR